MERAKAPKNHSLTFARALAYRRARERFYIPFKQQQNNNKKSSEKAHESYIPAKCKILNLVLQWSNTNLKTKPNPFVPFASQNNAPTFLGRKSVLTSMIHSASRPQAENSGFPPAHGVRGRETTFQPSPSRAASSWLCRRELERPSVTSSGPRCSPEEGDQRTRVFRSSRGIRGLTF